MRIPSSPSRVRHGQMTVAALLLALTLLGACGQRSPQDLVVRAKEAGEKGEFVAAVLHLKSALQASPDSAETRFLLGKAMIEAGDVAGAVVEFAKCLDQGYDRERVLPELAHALLLSGQAKRLTSLYGGVDLAGKQAQATLKAYMASAWGALEDRSNADAALKAALAAVPDHPHALLLRARVSAGAGDFDGALAVVDGVLARDAKRHEAWLLKGEILAFAKKDVAAAEDAFRKSLAIERRFLPAHTALISSRLRAEDLAGAKAQLAALRAVAPNHPQTVFVDGYLEALQKHYGRARELIQLVLRVLPDHTMVLQLAGAIEGELGALVLAESYYAKALRLDPALVNARQGLARAQLRLGKPARAWETIQPLAGPESTDSVALALAGEAALALGDTKAAEAVFRRAAKVEPDNARARTALAMTTLARGDATEAFSKLQTIAAESTDTYADLALVSAHLKRAEFDAALTAVDVLSRKQPDSALPHELRGRVLATRGDLAGARSAFDKSAQLDPGSFSTTSSLAEIDLREKKFAQARNRLEAATRAQPGNVNAYVTLASVIERSGAPLDEVRRVLTEATRVAPSDVGARLQLIDASLRAKQFKEALAAAQSADASIPNNVTVLDALGRAQALAGDTQQALGTFRRITNLDTTLAQPHLRLAAMYRDQGATTAATGSLRRAIEIDPSLHQARVDLVDLLVRSNQQRQAIEIARELQTRTPEVDGGYLLEGATHVRMKDADAAIAAYRNGLKRARDTREIARQLYRVLATSGRGREADAFAEGWIKGNPDDAAMHFELSSTALARRNLQVAEKHLRLSIALRADHPVALNNLAWVLTSLGKPGALPLAQRAVELLPNEPSMLDTLATALAADKQLPEALRVQKRAVEIAPGNPGLRLNLAKLALQADDKALARLELDRLASLGTRVPFHEEVARLRKTL